MHMHSRERSHVQSLLHPLHTSPPLCTTEILLLSSGIILNENGSWDKLIMKSWTLGRDCEDLCEASSFEKSKLSKLDGKVKLSTWFLSIDGCWFLHNCLWFWYSKKCQIGAIPVTRRDEIGDELLEMTNTRHLAGIDDRHRAARLTKTRLWLRRTFIWGPKFL